MKRGRTWICVCMYVCMYACMHVCMYALFSIFAKLDHLWVILICWMPLLFVSHILAHTHTHTHTLTRTRTRTRTCIDMMCTVLQNSINSESVGGAGFPSFISMNAHGVSPQVLSGLYACMYVHMYVCMYVCIGVFL